MKFRNLFSKLKIEILKIRCYYSNAQNEIAIKNLGFLRILALSNAGLVLIFCCLRMLILPEWTVSLYDGLYLGFTLFVYSMATLYKNKGAVNSKFVVMLCLLFQASLLLFVIIIDTIQKPNAPGSYMSVLGMALPAAFILPFRYTYPLILVFEAFYIAVATLTKDPVIARYDIFHALIGLATSVPLSFVITQLRVNDYTLRIRYQHLSTQDALSGVLNKAACIDAIQCYLANTAPHTMCGLLLFDVDDFKHVNDALGHQAGDGFLAAFGQLLTETFRADDVVGRFGGDEFLVLVSGVRDLEILRQKCQMVLSRMPAAIGNGKSIPVSASIGAIHVSGQTANFDALFHQADNAVYEAKRSGKNRCIVESFRFHASGNR